MPIYVKGVRPNLGITFGAMSIWRVLELFFIKPHQNYTKT